jgi:hypothetical protein
VDNKIPEYDTATKSIQWESRCSLRAEGQTLQDEQLRLVIALQTRLKLEGVKM